MKSMKKPLQTCKAKLPLDEYRRLVFLHAPTLGRLLDNLDAGIISNPLEVMIALSECVAYFTDSDTVEGLPHAQVDIRSSRYCLSC